MTIEERINSLIEQLQGTNGLIDSLNNLERVFENRSLIEYELTELEECFTKFQEKFNQILSLYETFIALYIKTTNETERKTIKLFLDYCLVFLNRIQNKYCNAISYRINQINNQKSLKKANTSIVWGIISVIIGVLATVISVYYSVRPNRDLDFIKNEVKRHTTILDNFKTELKSSESQKNNSSMQLPPQKAEEKLIPAPLK